MSADRPKMRASRDDLIYVTTTVVDDKDQMLPDAVVRVSFAVSGAVEIAAVGNANPKDVGSFQHPQRNTFHGRCLAIVRPTGKAGAAEVRAESPELGSATLRLDVMEGA
jgi:beta-galactosidase